VFWPVCRTPPIVAVFMIARLEILTVETFRSVDLNALKGRSAVWPLPVMLTVTLALLV
jgi:hypothetical protein